MSFSPGSASQHPSISVIIPVHNGGESFRRCLDSLRQSSRQPMNDLNLDRTNRLSVVLSFIALGCLAGGWLNPWLWIVAVANMVGLIVINQRVYRFFWHKRGPLFALRVIP